MKIAIIGGGIMGISLAYFLTQQGAQVEIFEASPTLGGLAGPLTLPDGTEVDRFYHAILPSDGNLNQLCAELGISDQLCFRATRTGFYYQGRICSMNNIVEFMRFPPLGWIDRFRLGLTVLAAQRVRDWRTLEGTSIEDWIVRWSGRNTFQNIWKPMLRAKFDGNYKNVPATWVWSRLVRMKSARAGAKQQEGAGHLIGGYATMLSAMAKRIRANGSAIHLRTPVQEVVVEQDQVRGVRIGSDVRAFDAVAVTMQNPVFARLIPGATQAYRDSLTQIPYLGIICPLMVLDKPFTGFWTLNITDESIPFTGVIETTAYIDPKYVGGYHLIYLPKYTAPGSDWQQKSDEEIKQIWLHNIKKMQPHFDVNAIRYFLVHRERFVEPLHGLNEAHLMPQIKTPVANLYLATTSQIYPALTNGESVSAHASEAAKLILQTQPLQPQLA